MSVAEICALPVAELAADDAHLWLWVTNAEMFEAGPAVMAAWGFSYRSCLTWVKPRLGLGVYLRIRRSISSSACADERRCYFTDRAAGFTARSRSTAISPRNSTPSSSDARPVRIWNSLLGGGVPAGTPGAMK
jgi:hypothetical protein